MTTNDGTKGGEQESKTITVDGEAPLESIEITIADDGAAGAVETKDDKQQTAGDDRGGEKKQPKSDVSKRIGKERALRAEAETTAQRLLRENEELKQRLEKTSGDLQVADRAAFNNHASNVANALKIAKADLVKATNDGDAEKIADATAEVSRLAAEQGRVDNWKKAHPEPEPGAKPEPRTETKPQQQSKEQPKFTPELQDFLDRSPWFVPNSGEFDKDMHTEARNFATTLERRYHRQGKADQIGTPGYYQEIEKHVRSEFPDYDWEDDGGEPPTNGALPKMGADQRQVGSRSSSNGGQPNPNGSSTKITLTGEQRQFVRGMVDQGAYGINPETKKPYTYAEAEVRYARQVKVDRDNQRQRAGG